MRDAIAGLLIVLSTLTACDDGGAGASADAAARPDSDVGEAATVRISGVTYVLEAEQGLPGVVVRVVEYPDLQTTSDEQGRYALEVPAGTPFTPYASHAAYLDIYHRTFDGTADVDRVHFQLISPGVFSNYVALLGQQPDPERCQIVIGVSSFAIQAMSFEEIARLENDGVAGVTVTAEPPIPVMFFFREGGPPTTDPPETSADSNLICTNVTPGSYVVSGAHSSRTFEPFTVRCEPGRLVNASRPWGLRER